MELVEAAPGGDAAPDAAGGGERVRLTETAAGHEKSPTKVRMKSEKLIKLLKKNNTCTVTKSGKNGPFCENVPPLRPVTRNVKEGFPRDRPEKPLDLLFP